MIKVRIVHAIGKITDLKTMTFDHKPNLEELRSHLFGTTRQKNFKIVFDDFNEDMLRAVDNDDALAECFRLSGDVVTFMLTRPTKVKLDLDAYQNEIEELVGLGIGRNFAQRMLSRYGGDINLAREEAKIKSAMDMLAKEGLKPRRKLRTLVVRFNGDLDTVRREFANDNGGNGKRKRKKEKGCEKRRTKRKRLNDNSEVETGEKGIKIEVKDQQIIHPTEGNIPTSLASEFFENYSKIFLDGNNMLFIENEIRTLVLKPSQRAQGEKILSNIALCFTRTLNESREDTEVMLMFDSSSLHGFSDENYEIVSAAVLGFNIADDALVSYAESQDKDAEDSLFITSDKALQKRLTDLGMSVMGSGAFLKLTKEVIGSKLYQGYLAQENMEDE
jgi:rRNA-processing protein FCF1